MQTRDRQATEPVRAPGPGRRCGAYPVVEWRPWRRWVAGAALWLGVASALSCGQGPVEVSDTEIWQLELEQVDDGGEGYNPRRGTITMQLRLNHTTQPDPTCTGQEIPNVTTFLADVEVAPSRMSSGGTGTADGSWNCHGFSAVVRLDDGTSYDLRSDSGAGVFSTMAYNSWNGSTGSRGSFLLQPMEDIDYGPRQSHFDLVVENPSEHNWRVALIDPLDIDVRGLHYSYNPSAKRDSADYFYYVDAPAGNTVRISWPAHQNRREGRTITADPEVREMYLRDDPYVNWGITVCVLGPDHPDQMHIVYESDVKKLPTCGDGWIGHVILNVDRSPLFLQPGEEDSVSVLTQFNDTLTVESSHASVTAELGAWVAQENEFFRRYPLEVRASPDAPRTERNLTLRGLYWGEVEQFAFVPVSVYTLELAPAADTLIIAPGARDTTGILLDTEGVFGGIRFRAVDLPSGVLLVPPSFAPSETNVTAGVGTTVTMAVAPEAGPGIHDITICAIIPLDPEETCHFTTVTLVIPASQPDFSVTADPAALQLAPGASTSTTIRVNRNGFGVGLVSVSVNGLPPRVTATFDEPGDTSVMTLSAAPDAPSGVYQLTVEGTNGPLTRAATIDLTVGDGGAGACAGFNLRLDFDTITVYPGTNDIAVVFVDRDAGFAQQVELVLEGTNGAAPSDVFSSWLFDPNPAGAGAAWSTLRFTTQTALDPGERFSLVIRGASPTFEDPAAVCQLPMVAEVAQ